MTQVTNSKGTEWMVHSYNEWQRRSPLPATPQKSTSSFLQIVSKLAQKENQLNSAMALSFRTIVIILGVILSFKSR